MSDELRESLENAIYKLLKPQHPQQVANIADAAIALVRDATLEEAARAAEGWAERNVMDDMSWRDCKQLVAAIRALKGQTTT